MTFRSALVGSAVWFLMTPGSLIGVIPWLLAGSDHLAPLWISLPAGLCLLSCVIVLCSTFLGFARDGQGTPAPVGMPGRLVITGFYRRVRNPMYVAAIVAVLCEAVLFQKIVLAGYAAVLASLFHLIVTLREEPRLARQFGDQYETYRRSVPRWLPRLRPWRPVCTGVDAAS